jgi:hypothetical protein
MPHRVNSWVSAVFTTSLAAAVLLSPNSAASAAADPCLEKPDLEVTQAGHWYYYVDRVHHRRCWFFEASEATVSPRASSADRLPTPNTDSEKSWLSRFAAGVTQAFSSEPKQSSIPALSSEPKQSSISAISLERKQSSISAFSSELPQNGISDRSGTLTKTLSPKHVRIDKIANRSQLEPPLTTNGLAGAALHDQLPPQRISEKDDKQSRQLTAAERQALFEEFLKWYMERSIFGRP